MPDTRDLVQQVAQEIEASKTTSPTPPGQTEAQRRAPVDEGHIEAINQVFALFRLNYHNQYYAAYPDAEQVKQIKKLWLDALADYPVEQILRGAKHAIENSEYLPTLHRMIESCQASISELGLPAAHDAYLEACCAPSPRSAQAWSHPAVYFAGRDSDWFFLENNPEKKTWPVFKEHYQAYCARVMQGEQLEIPAPAALEEPKSEPMSPEERLSAVQRLREETGFTGS